MNEYWLMLFLVSAGMALAWAIFHHLAELAIWSRRRTLDTGRYGLITVCLAIQIGITFELWEAAALSGVSMFAMLAARRGRARAEAALHDLLHQD